LKRLDLEVTFKAYRRPMNGLRISELAARTGFSPPTLRYYERIGVLPPPDRTESGYRVYGESTVDLLQFITRARALGLSLEETAELAALWSGDRCEPVQSRLATLLHEKLDDARTRRSELSAFIDQLERVSKQLGRHVPDGPCDDECGCIAGSTPAMFEQLAIESDAQIACTLGPSAIGPRLDAWRRLIVRKRGVEPVHGGVRIAFGDAVRAAEVAQLAEAEQSCCSFLSFTIAVGSNGVTLDIVGPREARPVIDELVGLVP
jgi:DNA-binding transcriptional MerR regulator